MASNRTICLRCCACSFWQINLLGERGLMLVCPEWSEFFHDECAFSERCLINYPRAWWIRLNALSTPLHIRQPFIWLVSLSDCSELFEVSTQFSVTWLTAVWAAPTSTQLTKSRTSAYICLWKNSGNWNTLRTLTSNFLGLYWAEGQHYFLETSWTVKQVCFLYHYF